MAGDNSEQCENDGSMGHFMDFENMRRRLQKPHPMGLPLFFIALVLSASVIISPLLIDNGEVDLGSDGSVGGHEHDEDIDGIDNEYARFVYRLGDVYCHQKSERSYVLNDNQMPVCSRDLGLFLGLFVGSVFGVVYRRRMTLGLCVLFLIPMAVDGGIQSLTSYESINILRLVTGLVAGFGIGRYVNSNLLSAFGILSAKRPRK